MTCRAVSPYRTQFFVWVTHCAVKILFKFYLQIDDILSRLTYPHQQVSPLHPRFRESFRVGPPALPQKLGSIWVGHNPRRIRMPVRDVLGNVVRKRTSAIQFCLTARHVPFVANNRSMIFCQTPNFVLSSLTTPSSFVDSLVSLARYAVGWMTWFRIRMGDRYTQ